MSEAEAQAGVASYFDAFVEAFATFDGSRVAVLFATPSVALRRDGTLAGFRTTAEVAAYYQAALDRYRDAGCRSCRWRDLDLSFLNETSANAVVSWDLLGTGMSVVASWRQAYFLTASEGAWRTYGSAFVRACALKGGDECRG